MPPTMPKKNARSIPAVVSQSPKGARTGIRKIWTLGRDLRAERREDETVKSLKKRLNRKESEDLIYKAIQFADRVDQDELKTLLKLESANKFRLSWSHVAALVSIENQGIRLKCATAAAVQELSNRALRELIQTTLGTGNRRQGSGRKWLAKTPLTEAIGRICGQFARLEAQFQAFKQLDGVKGRADRETQIDGLIGHVNLCQSTFQIVAQQFAQTHESSQR